jgi:putative transcriptional regulator
MDLASSVVGKLLVASPLIIEPIFFRTVVLLLDHNEEGAFGVVLNRPSDEAVADHLPEWAGATADPGVIHLGGPVDPAVGTALGAGGRGQPGPIPGISILDLENPPDESTHGVRIYAGYSGWGSGQLENELAEGAWYLVDAAPDDPFADPADQWASVLRRQSGRLAMVANFPEDASLN